MIGTRPLTIVSCLPTVSTIDLNDENMQSFFNNLEHQFIIYVPNNHPILRNKITLKWMDMVYLHSNTGIRQRDTTNPIEYLVHSSLVFERCSTMVYMWISLDCINSLVPTDPWLLFDRMTPGGRIHVARGTTRLYSDVLVADSAILSRIMEIDPLPTVEDLSKREKKDDDDPILYQVNVRMMMDNPYALLHYYQKTVCIHTSNNTVCGEETPGVHEFICVQHDDHQELPRKLQTDTMLVEFDRHGQIRHVSTNTTQRRKDIMHTLYTLVRVYQEEMVHIGIPIPFMAHSSVVEWHTTRRTYSSLLIRWAILLGGQLDSNFYAWLRIRYAETTAKERFRNIRRLFAQGERYIPHTVHFLREPWLQVYIRTFLKQNSVLHSLFDKHDGDVQPDSIEYGDSDSSDSDESSIIHVGHAIQQSHRVSTIHSTIQSIWLYARFIYHPSNSFGTVHRLVTQISLRSTHIQQSSIHYNIHSSTYYVHLYNDIITFLAYVQRRFLDTFLCRITVYPGLDKNTNLISSIDYGVSRPIYYLQAFLSLSLRIIHGYLHNLSHLVFSHDDPSRGNTCPNFGNMTISELRNMTNVEHIAAFLHPDSSIDLENIQKQRDKSLKRQRLVVVREKDQTVSFWILYPVSSTHDLKSLRLDAIRIMDTLGWYLYLLANMRRAHYFAKLVTFKYETHKNNLPWKNKFQDHNGNRRSNRILAYKSLGPRARIFSGQQGGEWYDNIRSIRSILDTVEQSLDEYKEGTLCSRIRSGLHLYENTSHNLFYHACKMCFIVYQTEKTRMNKEDGHRMGINMRGLYRHANTVGKFSFVSSSEGHHTQGNMSSIDTQDRAISLWQDVFHIEKPEPNTQSNSIFSTFPRMHPLVYDSFVNFSDPLHPHRPIDNKTKSKTKGRSRRSGLFRTVVDKWINEKT